MLQFCLFSYKWIYGLLLLCCNFIHGLILIDVSSSSIASWKGFSSIIVLRNFGYHLDSESNISFHRYCISFYSQWTFSAALTYLELLINISLPSNDLTSSIVFDFHGKLFQHFEPVAYDCRLLVKRHWAWDELCLSFSIPSQACHRARANVHSKITSSTCRGRPL